jgi:uncharacterized alkaline shock family protein YloU
MSGALKMGEHKGYIKNTDEKGSINISEDVVAIIAAAAAAEVEGVHGLFFPHGKELTQMIGRKGLSRGVRLCIDGDNVTIDVYVMVEMGYSVSEVGVEIQGVVMSAVEAAVGVTVSAVNIHICGVALKKNKKDI